MCWRNIISLPKMFTTWMRKGFSSALNRRSRSLLIVTRRMYTPLRMGIVSLSQLLRWYQLRDHPFCHQLFFRGSIKTLSGVETILVMQGMHYSYMLYNISDLCASISHSLKGWTDQKLGEMWIKKDFKPASAARNQTGHHCLLVLDGHNSHCIYTFCKFAASHNIIIICLPC